VRRINLFTIPPGASFADELARGVLARFSADDPFELSRALILLPTRRAIRALGEAFARVVPSQISTMRRRFLKTTRRTSPANSAPGCRRR
jgi:inactivated superfamily I helicase